MLIRTFCRFSSKHFQKDFFFGAAIVVTVWQRLKMLRNRKPSIVIGFNIQGRQPLRHGRETYFLKLRAIVGYSQYFDSFTLVPWAIWLLTFLSHFICNYLFHWFRKVLVSERLTNRIAVFKSITQRFQNGRGFTNLDFSVASKSFGVDKFDEFHCYNFCNGFQKITSCCSFFLNIYPLKHKIR